jgi:hypothetical protein
VDVLELSRFSPHNGCDAHATRYQGKHVRGAFEKLLAACDAGKAIVNLFAEFSADLDRLRVRLAGKLLYVYAEGLGCGRATGRGMRLFEQAGFAQPGHDVTDGRCTHTFNVRVQASNCLRGNWLTGCNVHVDDGGQYKTLAPPDPELGHPYSIRLASG